MKLDLGCGQRTTEGFKGADIKAGPNVDYVVDLFAGKRWPWKNNSVDEVVSNHLVEHIPHYRPEYKGADGWFVFFNELYRVMKPDATAVFNHPYSRNDRAFWDPTHTRYIHEMTWYYLDRNWREAQALDHYDAKCDFEVVTITTQVADQIHTRSHDAQQFARSFYFNSVGDLSVVIKARK